MSNIFNYLVISVYVFKLYSVCILYHVKGDLEVISVRYHMSAYAI